MAAMVRRGCMACSAVKCKKEDSLRDWRRTRGCLQESGGFFFFFLRVPFTQYLLLHVHPGGKDGHPAHAGSAWLDAQCCNGLPSWR